MDLGSIGAKMVLDISNFTNQLALAETQAVKLAQKTSKAFQFGDSLTQVGKTATKALTVPILAMAAASVKIGNDFEFQMSRVGAIAGATGKELKALSANAVELGAKTNFNARQAAEGMENLASAGFDVNEIIGAMPGVLDLAAVSGGDVALASEAMATTLRAFGKEASEAGHVADVFARAAADTNAEASDMAEAMKYAAPVAHAMGISMEETAAAIGLMSDAGIKGSQAGTTLRGAFSRLAKPTKQMKESMDELGISFFDAEGNMLPLKDQIGLLKEATSGLTQEEKNRHLVSLYGQQSLSGMLALVEAGPDKLDAMTKSLENADGAAKEMADQMMDNTKVAITQMLGAFESAAIVIQQILSPAIRVLVDGIAKMVRVFVNASPLGQKLTVIFGAMLAALGPLLFMVGFAITTFAKFKIALAILGKTAITATGWIGLIVVAVYALVAIFMIAYTKSEKFRNVINSIIPVLKAGLSKAIELTQVGLEKLGQVIVKVADWLADNFGTAVSAVKELLSKIAPAVSLLAEAFKKLLSSGIEKVSELFGKIKETLGGALGTAIGFISDQLEKMGGSFGKVGGVAGIIAGVLVKLGIAVLGLSGPWGALASVVGTFLIMWAKTGEINADGIAQVFDNLNSTIENAAGMITTYLPKFIDIGMNLLLKLIEGITSAIPMFVNVWLEMFTFIMDTILQLLPMLLDVGMKLLLALIEGITQALPQIVEAMIQVLEFIVQALVTALPLILDVGLKILLALIEGILVALPAIIEAVVLIITTLVALIISLLPTIIAAGIQILMALIAGIIQILPALIEAAITIILSLLSALIGMLPMIIDAGIQILLAIVQGLISMIPTLLTAAIQIITSLLGAIIQFLPQLLSAGVQLLLALISGLFQILPQLIAAGLKLIGMLIVTIVKMVPQILSAGVQLILALVRGVLSLLGAVIGAAVKLGTSLVTSIAGFAGKLLSAGGKLILQFISGIGSKISATASKAKEIGTSVVTAVSGFAGKMSSAAKDMVQGFINGIGDSISGVADKAKEMATAATDTVKKFLKIKSPSRLMAKLGGYTGEGFVNGIGAMIGKAGDMATRMAKTVSDNMSDVKVELPENDMRNSVKNAMGRVSDAMKTGLNLPELEVATSAAGTLNGSYPDVDAHQPEPKKVEPEKFTSGKEGTGDVYIDTIVVRDDNDLDALTQGLYNDSKQKLSALGNTRK